MDSTYLQDGWFFDKVMNAAGTQCEDSEEIVERGRGVEMECGKREMDNRSIRCVDMRYVGLVVCFFVAGHTLCDHIKTENSTH